LLRDVAALALRSPPGWCARTSRRSARTTRWSTPRAAALAEDRSEYDVIVTENLFGDILTDLAAVLGGSMAGAVRVAGPGRARVVRAGAGYEPDIAKGRRQTRYGAIGSVALLMRHRCVSMRKRARWRLPSRRAWRRSLAAGRGHGGERPVDLRGAERLRALACGRRRAMPAILARAAAPSPKDGTARPPAAMLKAVGFTRCRSTRGQSSASTRPETETMLATSLARLAERAKEGLTRRAGATPMELNTPSP